MRRVLLAGVLLTAGACSMVTVEQEPFSPLEIQAKKPAKPAGRVVLTESSIAITEKVQFDVGKAEILEVSFPLLDEIAAMLRDNPQIEVLQVEGHTDSSGSAKKNKKLSQARADSVLKYLVDKGIEKARLVSKGFGPDQPIADNETDEGREQNRRVEFNIVKQGPKKTIVEEED